MIHDEKHVKDFQSALLQYFGMYLCIGFVGPSFLGIIFSSDQFLVVALAYAILCILISRKIDCFPRGCFVFFVVFLFTCIVSYIYSDGNILLTSSMNVFLRFLVVVSIILISTDDFSTRFVRFATFAAGYSLIGELLTFSMGAGWINRIGFSITPINKSLLFYNYTPLHNLRNIGAFNEPGQYQIFLSIALYMLLCTNVKLDGKKKSLYTGIIVVTIITAQSTAGYIALLGFIVYFIFSHDMRIGKKVWILIISIAFIVYIFFYLDKQSGLYYNIIGKILTEGQSIDISQGSGGARIIGFELLLDVLKQHPNAIWGIGYNQFITYGMESCASLVGNLLGLGFPIWFVMHTGILVFGYKSIGKSLKFVLFIFLILLTEMSQPNLLNIFILFPCYLFLGTLENDPEGVEYL